MEIKMELKTYKCNKTGLELYLGVQERIGNNYYYSYYYQCKYKKTAYTWGNKENIGLKILK